MNQILTLQTIVGPKELRAPEGFVFDKTAISLWSALLIETRRQPKMLRDRNNCHYACNVLANVLSNSLGMSTFYWEEQARVFAKEKPA